MKSNWSTTTSMGVSLALKSTCFFILIFGNQKWIVCRVLRVFYICLCTIKKKWRSIQSSKYATHCRAKLKSVLVEVDFWPSLALSARSICAVKMSLTWLKPSPRWVLSLGQLELKVACLIFKPCSSCTSKCSAMQSSNSILNFIVETWP